MFVLMLSINIFGYGLRGDMKNKQQNNCNSLTLMSVLG